MAASSAAQDGLTNGWLYQVVSDTIDNFTIGINPWLL
jgi:hypothetical protein